MSENSRPRIFVQIASYRDSECHHTISDLFARAAHPERVFVGVCWQYDPEADAEYLEIPYPRHEQVRVKHFHYADAKGAGWARVEAQKLWDGEEYVLQVQAHMRFEQGWDETLIATLEALPSRKAILTAWLPGYHPPDTKQDVSRELPVAIANRLGGKNDAQMLHLIKRMVPKASLDSPFPTGMWVGNFMFAHAEVMQHVPFDPHIYFWGEEINYSARLWTHGYDIYHLHRAVLYHYWDRAGVKDAEIYRNHRDARNKLSLERNRHLFGIEQATSPEALVDMGDYALGAERSLEDYWRYLGVDWKHGNIAPFAREGHFTIPRALAPNETIFVSIASYRDPELQPTIDDLLAKAAHPGRIRIGVCAQTDSQDENCLPKPHPQLRVIEANAAESKGANWARAQAMSLHEGEDYILQIDSHMRFEQGWDVMLAGMLARVPNPRSVISAYLPNYDPPNQLSDGPLLRMCVRRIGRESEAQLVHLTGFYTEEAALAPTPFVIANFMFARKEVWRDVPIDPHIYFYGDEISMSARLWTHGIDVYQPDAVVAYHYWVRKDELAKHPYRKSARPEAEVSRLRVRHLLGIETTANAEALAELANYSLGNARSIKDYWEVAGVDIISQSVSQQAQIGAWCMQPVRRDAQEIFVRIASYRDSELQATIDDLFAKAAHPERVFVGVCCQYDAKDARSSYDIDERGGKVRIVHVPWQEATGVCWARAQTETLWRGEAYTLQIDSHMRFAVGWDDFLISELAACDSQKPIISCNPARYTPPNHLQEPHATIRVANPFGKDGNLRCKGVELETPPDAPLRGAFIAAGLVFSRSDVLTLVPYDPYYYFNQEEIAYALRLWTHGFDVYSASRQYFYHYYNEGQNDRPLHWDDLEKLDAAKLRFLAVHGLARFNHMSGYRQSSDANTLFDIERFALGKVRSVSAFEQFTGLDFTTKTAHERALMGEFIGTSPEQAKLTPLEAGDSVPHFIATDVEGKSRGIERFADKPCLLLALSDVQKLESIPPSPDYHVIALVNIKPAQTSSHMVLIDDGHRIAKTLGIPVGAAFVLSRNLQVRSVVRELAQLDMSLLSEQETPVALTRNAPVLILPNVFSPELCRQLIKEFESGNNFDGVAGVDGNYQPQSKRRRDMIVEAPLIQQLDDKLARAVFPEIEKVFGFTATSREIYKLGLYSGEQEGFFNAHRDNYDPKLAHRRMAMTINLSDDYEGGELRFPEYGANLYRPGLGSAILFPCTLLHEVCKVTKGKRYVLLGFFHGAEEESFRREGFSAGEDKGEAAYALPVRDLSALKRSRDFFRQWLKKRRL